MGAASYICHMFIRRNKNRSCSVSIQINKKVGRRNKVIKTVGCARTHYEEELLFLLAKTEVERMDNIAMSPEKTIDEIKEI